MHEATHTDLTAEINALNDGTARTSSTPTPAPGVISQPKLGQLSKKTISMLTDLAAAASGAPSEYESPHEHVLSEMELAERELAVDERKRSSEVGATTTALPVSAGGIASLKPGAGQRKQKGDDKDYDVLIKLLLLGDGGVGKTSLMLRYSEDKFSSSLLATAGVDYKTQFLDVDGKRVKCQIWLVKILLTQLKRFSEASGCGLNAHTSTNAFNPHSSNHFFCSHLRDTAGQQRFHVITQAYYRGGKACVVCSTYMWCLVTIACLLPYRSLQPTE